MGKPEKRVTIKEEPRDVKPAEEGPVPWDAEEDHLLSYFLEGGDVARHRSDSESSPRVPPMPPAPSHPGVPPGPTTMTPAVHYYAGASSKPSSAHPEPSAQSQPAAHPPQSTATTGSLNNMASMAAALVGGPVFPSAEGKTEGDTTISPGDSTISPTAAMITSLSPENLMLPPQTQRTEEEKQQHLQWLQQINAIAMMARQTPTQANGSTPHSVHHGYPPLPPQAAAVLSSQPPSQPSPQETEEKRARRLARNRESARQSRARKKEKLLKLEQQVTLLFGQVEQDRRAKLEEMEAQLQYYRIQELAKLHPDTISRETLREFLQHSGPNTTIRQRVASFQYEKLKQYSVPRHQEFLLWLSLQQDDFFGKAKEIKSATQTKTGRISSKQIGEELSQEFKKSPKQVKKEEDEEEKLTSSCNDIMRMWPLLCFELSVSVDQEERLIQAQARSRQVATLPHERAQKALTTRTFSNLRKGVLFQAHAASMRSSTTLLDILTPSQSVKFLQWMEQNKTKCRDLMEAKTSAKQIYSEAKTLSDMCKRLDEVLRFPKGVN